MRLSIYILLFLCSTRIDAQRVSLLFAGDIMMHKEQIESATILADSIYDFEPCFQYIQPIISQADLAIGNLELTLPGEPPYQGFPYFKSPDTLAVALKKAGFDIIGTANNHSNDANKRGLIHTIDVLEKSKLLQTGTFRNQMERELFYPLIVHKNGFQLAFINCTFSTNKRKTIPPTIVNRIDYDEIQADIAEAKRLGADAVIAYIHWGREYDLEENSEQERVAKKLFRWGVDVIVGSHPHVVQPIKYVPYRAKDGTKKRGLVAYSLGNFISGQHKIDTDGGILLEVEFVRDMDTQKTFIGEVSYIPVWRFIKAHTDGRKTYHTIPIATYEGTSEEIGLQAKDKKAMAIFAKRTRKRLENELILERKIPVNSQ